MNNTSALSQNKLVIVARMPSEGISGGRYFTLIMAEAAAIQGFNVCLWVDCYPNFCDEFKCFPGHTRLTFHVDPEYSNPPVVSANFVIIAPHRAIEDKMYFSSIKYAQKAKAYLTLINFESPDWFNSLSPEQQPESMWNGWNLCARYADGIISIAEEGDKWARNYYKKITKNVVFSYAYPPINEYAIMQSPNVDSWPIKISCITRFGYSSAHKGAQELADAINERWRGRVLIIICGHPPEGIAWQRILSASEKYGVTVDLHCRVSEIEKFRLLGESSLLIFLTRFEGYGYPPIESIWAGTPVLCSDLPVLREITRGQAHFVDLQNDMKLGDEIEKALSCVTLSHDEVQKIMESTSVKAFGEKLAFIFEQINKRRRPISTSLFKRITYEIRYAARNQGGIRSFDKLIIGKLKYFIARVNNKISIWWHHNFK